MTLKECPFCGEKQRLTYDGLDHVVCENCWAYGPDEGLTQGWDRWNARTSDLEIASLRKEIKKLKSKIVAAGELLYKTLDPKS